MAEAPHQTTARAILAVMLSGADVPNSREAGFTAQLAFTPTDPTPRQARWLTILRDRFLGTEGGEA